VAEPPKLLRTVIRTVSAAGGVPGMTVSVPVRLTPSAVAVTFTAVVAVTAEVDTGNVPADWPPTTVSAGTLAIAGFALTSDNEATPASRHVGVSRWVLATPDDSHVTGRLRRRCAGFWRVRH